MFQQQDYASYVPIGLIIVNVLQIKYKSGDNLHVECMVKGLLLQPYAYNCNFLALL